jgi:hypothetical protein
MPRLEPDAVLIHQADNGDRHLEQACRKLNDPVKGLVRRRVENMVAAQRPQSIRFIVR